MPPKDTFNAFAFLSAVILGAIHIAALLWALEFTRNGFALVLIPLCMNGFYRCVNALDRVEHYRRKYYPQLYTRFR